jgi:phosphate transport system permease protein
VKRTSPRRLFADKAARWIVTAGGLAIIASILGILFFIIHEVVPLAVRATVTNERVHDIPGGSALAVLTDEYRELVAALDADGHVRVARVATGEILADAAIVPDLSSWRPFRSRPDRRRSSWPHPTAASSSSASAFPPRSRTGAVP